MALSQLLPIAGATLAPLATKAIDTFTDQLSFLSHLNGDGAVVADSTPNHDELRKLVQQLTERLQEEFSAAGLGSEPIELRSDGRGGVEVDGGHPHRVLIEAILASDSGLRQLFHQVATAAFGHEQLDDFRLRVEAGELSVRLA